VPISKIEAMGNSHTGVRISPFPPMKTCEWLSFRMDGQDVLCGQVAIVRSKASGRHYCEDHKERFHHGKVLMEKITEEKCNS
jgi:hypothetical protein